MKNLTTKSRGVKRGLGDQDAGKWCGVIEAARLALRSQSQLFRLAALGSIQIRRDGGQVYFLVADARRIGHQVRAAQTPELVLLDPSDPRRRSFTSGSRTGTRA